MKSSAAPLPLIGRETELAMLHTLLDEAGAGRGRVLILAGESGVGKSRLARSAADEAVRRGWNVAVGRAYPVESGVPYAPVSDAMLPLLRALSADALAVVTRGSEAELYSLFPALRPADVHAPVTSLDAGELKPRLLWNFAQLLGRLAAKKPLLLVVEDLQWADPSSLELLHFVARQLSTERIALLGTYNESQREQNPTLRLTEESLVALNAAAVHRLEVLSRTATADLVRAAFGAEPAVTRHFTDLLYEWTQGNPFFIEQTLQSLVEAGKLYERDGCWLGWELEEIQLPRSIRELMRARVGNLSTEARTIADLHAVVGTRASYAMLLAVTGMDEAEFVAALDELRRAGVVVERQVEDELVYDFSHTLLRETLYSELGRARARLLHASIAETLERHYDAKAEAHADELAFHFSRASAHHLAPKATRYLSIAGRAALARHAYGEAASYLASALELADRAGTAQAALIEDLARVRQRLGDFDAAIELWARARAEAEREGDRLRLARAERRLGLACFWSGRASDAIAHYEAGLSAADGAGNEAIRARLKLSLGECLQEIGRPADAAREIHEALALSERQSDLELVGRIHRVLLLLHTWTGPPERAREHGIHALEIADRTGNRALACATHWGLAVLEGLSGEQEACARHIAAGERLADEIRSPLHRLWLAEISIEYLASTGEWEAAIALAERTIAQARSFNQRALLPRLLVWTSLIYCGRHDLERARQYADEAWALSGAGDTDQPVDVLTVVPAHTARAGCHVAAGEYEEALRVGEAGLEIADRSGYTVWAVHRLLPIMAEACLWLRDLDRARRIGARLRSDSARLGHPLGLAWADTCDALVVWLGGNPAEAISLLRRSAEKLEAINVVPDAARLRRQLAGRLTDIGDKEGALRELRLVHDIFLRLGADRELSKTRDQFREIGARPPAREAAGSGAAGLTAREIEIVRLVAGRRSNKAIGQVLDISARTVSTHLSHIFRKLNVSSRGELAELARTLELREG